MSPSDFTLTPTSGKIFVGPDKYGSIYDQDNPTQNLTYDENTKQITKQDMGETINLRNAIKLNVHDKLLAIFDNGYGQLFEVIIKYHNSRRYKKLAVRKLLNSYEYEISYINGRFQIQGLNRHKIIFNVNIRDLGLASFNMDEYIPALNDISTDIININWLVDRFIRFKLKELGDILNDQNNIHDIRSNLEKQIEYIDRRTKHAKHNEYNITDKQLNYRNKLLEYYYGQGDRQIDRQNDELKKFVNAALTGINQIINGRKSNNFNYNNVQYQI